MRTRTRAFRIILAGAVASSICSPLISAQDLPEHAARIADGVYSYGPGDDYVSMFVVTDEGVNRVRVDQYRVLNRRLAGDPGIDRQAGAVPAPQPQPLGSRKWRSGLQGRRQAVAGCRSTRTGPGTTSGWR